MKPPTPCASTCRFSTCLSRREVVRGLALGATGVAVAGVTAACGSSSSGDDPDGSTGNGNDRAAAADAEVTVPAADVPPLDGAPYRSDAGEFYLVRNDDGVLAFSWTCTHQGCEVPWEDDERRFHCPCHGSIYDRNGVRLDGPAPRPLDLLPVRVLANGDVAVDPDQATEREEYAADQAAPYPVGA